MSQRPQKVGSLSAPGKVRTWWHPLFVQVLVFELADSAEVLAEVLVGKLPLRLDVLIVRRRHRLSARAQRDMPVLAGFLNRVTQIQYKGPTDVLEAADLPQFEGVALLWLGQQAAPVPAEDVTLLLVVPRVGDAVRSQAARLGYVLRQVQSGAYEVPDRAFAMYVLETDPLGEQDPVLALFSAAPLTRRQEITTRLQASGHGDLLSFLLQQVQQLREMGEDVMKTQFKDLKDLDRFEATVLAAIPAEKRLRGVPTEERLRGVPTEERLRGVPTEERLRGVPTEERLRGVPTEERLRGVATTELLRELLASRAQELGPDKTARLRQLLAEVEPPAKAAKKRKQR
jgi:hypothetical protein